VRKFDIARMLARKYNLTSYLEVATPTTGGTYAQVDRRQFTRCARLMYRCPPEFSDGQAVEYRTAAESAEGLYCDLVRGGARFDLVFIDSFHTYGNSLRDILFGLQLVRPHGIVLVHDCDPPNPEIATPQHHDGEWCGVTYAAFLDTVLGDPGLCYATVATDYGCGIISPRPRRELLYNNHDKQLAAEWYKLDLSQKFPFFNQNRRRLLHLISTISFERPLGSRIYGAYRVARRTTRDALNALV
jgi:hypothetical protein